MKLWKNINVKSLQKKKKRKMEIKFDRKKTQGWWNLLKKTIKKMMQNKINNN
jgi:hypothetical protein